MNNVSWILYVIDVIPSLGILGLLLCGLSILLLFILPPKGITMFGQHHDSPFAALDRPLPWVLMVIGAILASFTPSKETLYMIAASEVGEAIISSEEGRELVLDIKTILDLQIEKLKTGG